MPSPSGVGANAVGLNNTNPFMTSLCMSPHPAPRWARIAMEEARGPGRLGSQKRGETPVHVHEVGVELEGFPMISNVSPTVYNPSSASTDTPLHHNMSG